MRNALHIDPELLLSYAEQECSAADEVGIRSHLQKCSSCAKRYVELALRIAPGRIAAPDDIWPGILDKLRQQNSISHLRPVLLRIAFAAGTALLLGGLFITGRSVLQRRAPAEGLDFARYVAALEKTSASPNAENAQQTFSEFVPYDQQAALRETGLRPQVDGYFVAEHRVVHSNIGNIFELVYTSAKDSFVMFVAPSTAHLNFGKYHLLNADVKGVHCKRVQCPRQDIIWYIGADHQYVFMRKRSLPDTSADLFTDLLGTG